MHRTLPNILFIVIIFVLATALPLTTDILNLNLSQKIVDKPVEEIKIDPELTIVLPETSDSMDQSKMVFEVESTTSVFPDTFLDSIKIEVIKNNTVVATKLCTEVKYEIVDGDAQTKSIEIDKLSLLEGLNPGYYTFALKSEDEVLDYWWHASNLSYDKVLLKTAKQVPTNKLALTLYFPNHNYQEVIPVTRFVDLSKNRFRTLYTALYNGPKKGLGLYETAPYIPSSPNIKISKNQANIYMYSKNLTGFEDKFPLSAKAITKTYMAFDVLEGVHFIVDNKQTGSVMGVDLSKTYTDSAINSGFIGYSHETTHLFLLPIALKSSSFEDRVNEAWNLLKLNSETELFNQDMIPTVPAEVTLDGHQLEGTHLTITLSSQALTVLKAYPEYEKLMISSLLYTFTSLPEVETLTILVNGTPWKSADFDFTTPLSPDRYYNLEP